MSKNAIGYQELSLFAICKYNGCRLVRRVVMERVGGRGKGYVVGVDISMKALNYFDSCSFYYYCL